MARLSYSVPDGGAFVGVSVYSIAGRKIIDLAQGLRSAGIHTVTWKGLDREGRRLPAAIYFLRVKVGSWEVTRNVMLVH